MYVSVRLCVHITPISSTLALRKSFTSFCVGSPSRRALALAPINILLPIQPIRLLSLSSEILCNCFSIMSKVQAPPSCPLMDVHMQCMYVCVCIRLPATTTASAAGVAILLYTPWQW